MSKFTKNENKTSESFDWMLAIDFDPEISKVAKRVNDTLAKIFFA